MRRVVGWEIARHKLAQTRVAIARCTPLLLARAARPVPSAHGPAQPHQARDSVTLFCFLPPMPRAAGNSSDSDSAGVYQHTVCTLRFRVCPLRSPKQIHWKHFLCFEVLQTISGNKRSCTKKKRSGTKKFGAKKQLHTPKIDTKNNVNVFPVFLKHSVKRVLKHTGDN